MATAVFTFGRMQPPTTGHEKLINTIKVIAQQQKAEPCVYLSHTQDKKNNPLEYREKLRLAMKSFGYIVKPSKSYTIMQVMRELNQKYSDVIMVVGSDRVRSMETLLNQYNGKEYNFNKIIVVSAGTRDPDADDITGMSASKMREAAKEEDLKTFKEGLPFLLAKEAKKIMNTLRKGMKL